MNIRTLLLTSAVVASAAARALAQEPSTPPNKAYFSKIPPAGRRAFFGELHLHTTMSFDAWSFGTRITPDQAYRFGRGETVLVPREQVQAQEHIRATHDVPARRAWPLDFMAVTDHAENMGVFNQFEDPNNPLSSTSFARELEKDRQKAFYLIANAMSSKAPAPKLHATEAMKSAWQVEIKAANDNYRPGRFTTFIAYEWTSMLRGKYNLHRNVVFNSDRAPEPFTSFNSVRPEDLWTYLEKVRAQGIDAIAIPHNGNASSGLMYDWNDTTGHPIDEVYAQRRALNEPLTEIVQNKGQSDTVPELSPSDEFANFEVFDQLLNYPNIKSQPNGSYVRQAFGRGLVIQSKVGVNPYKYGVVGGSDIHNGLTTSDEAGMASDAFGIDPKTMTPRGDAAKAALDIIKTPADIDMDSQAPNATPTMETPLKFSSAGITGVWAEENTRNSIFAALKRKETFATSGTRIRVRMFAGWTFSPDILKSRDWAAKAYAEGVPMGGDLAAGPVASGAPRFILQAQKDPEGANLDRVQIIKIWLEDGEYKEKIFNVALSDGRRPDAGGHVRPVGDTVNLRTGAVSNTIGSATLTSTWKDPEFNPHKPAVYYARVLEIPTPRWSTLLAIKNHLPIPKTVPATIQERAWTSPIWFTPARQ